MKFRFMVIGGPAEGYIHRCLSSILEQKNPNWTAEVVLDPVGDKTYEQAKTHECPKLRVRLNEKRMYALPNLMKARNLLSPDPEDVLITLDADDWLYTPYALDVLGAYYAMRETWLTHGSWVSFPNPADNTNNAPYSRQDFSVGIRKVPFRASHLRTFKAKLWDAIDKEHFKDAEGKYFQTAWDLAFMFPMLEMAGFDRVRFIQHDLLMYNQETPFNDGKLYLRQQMFYTDYIAAMPSYSRRETL